MARSDELWGGRRVHRQPRRRPLVRPARADRARPPPRRPRPLRRARDSRAALSRCSGSGRARRPRRCSTGAGPTPRLARLRGSGFAPIVGLVHHGSGPRVPTCSTSAVRRGLARFAGAVAERYPWVAEWTPVNEPLTTARFSALYGHWYPHGRSDPGRSSARSSSSSRDASGRWTRSAQCASRRRLVQTEDVGAPPGPPRLWNQAAFENHRRWLSLDLLFGPCRPRGTRSIAPCSTQGSTGRRARGASSTLLARPTCVGLNYYVTSDRWLDERIELHPRWSHGGNGVQSYADVHTSLGHPRDLFGHRGARVGTAPRGPGPRGATGRTSCGGCRRPGRRRCSCAARGWTSGP